MGYLMKKNITISILFISNLILVYFLFINLNRDPEIKIVEKTKIKTEIKYRNYNQLDYNAILDELKKYDLSDPILDGEIEGKTFHAYAGLNGRKWSRDFDLKVNENSRWKYYIGIGTLGVAIGSYCAYKVLK